MKRILLFVCIVAVVALGVEAKRLQRSINEFAEDSTLAYASVGVSVYSLQQNKELAGWKSTTADIPASTMKTLSCATALESLGEEFVFDTKVEFAEGVDRNNKPCGVIVVHASGDPTLGSKYFKDNPNIIGEIVAKLNRLGVSKVCGIEIVPKKRQSEGFCINWTADDVAYDYGAGAYMFNYADNCFSLPIEIGANTINIGKPNLDIPGLTVDNQCVLSEKDGDRVMSSPDCIRGLDSNNLILTGVVAKSGGRRRLDCSMPDPRAYFESELKKKLVQSGISVVDEKMVGAVKDTVVLLHHESPMLKDIVKSALYRSDNMFTQAMLMRAAYEKYGVWDFNTATQYAIEHWQAQGLDMNQLFMADGSGLARCNKVTPLFLTTMLAKAYANSVERESPYPQKIAISGGEGTNVHTKLADSNCDSRIALKSGSMTGVQCYAGYYPVENPRFSIAIMVNNFNGSRKHLKGLIDDLIINLIPELSKSKPKR